MDSDESPQAASSERESSVADDVAQANTLDATAEMGSDAREDDRVGRKGLKEVGRLGVWSVTSAKPGNGVDLMRDGREDTYWQSDGMQPHLVQVQFQRKVKIQHVAMYLDYRMDESYTPNRIAVRVGTSFYDLKEVRVVDLEEPQGWISIPLYEQGKVEYLRAFLLQIAILSNHQNGRDTHIRKIKVFGPREDSRIRAVVHSNSYSTVAMQMHSSVR